MPTWRISYFFKRQRCCSMGLIFFFSARFFFVLFYDTRIEVIIWASLCFVITSGLNKSPFITATHRIHISRWTRFQHELTVMRFVSAKLDACGIYAKPSTIMPNNTAPWIMCYKTKGAKVFAHSISIWMNEWIYWRMQNAINVQCAQINIAAAFSGIHTTIWERFIRIATKAMHGNISFISLQIKYDSM